MTSLDQNTAPLSADRLAEIKAKLERAHTEIGEVAAQGPHRRFRMSVPSRPDRDTDLIISDALEAAEVLLAEVARLHVELKANRQRWYHDDQSRTECVAGFDSETRECAEGGGKVFSEVEYQAQLIEIWTDLTRSYERDAAQLQSQVDRLISERDRLSDAYALDVELTKANDERADLANRVSVLQDHVAALEADARAALAIDWDALKAAVAGLEGVEESAVPAVLGAFRQAVSR